MRKIYFGFKQATNNLSIFFYLVAIIIASLMFNDPIIVLIIFFSLLLMFFYSRKSDGGNYLKFSIIIFLTTVVFNLIINQKGSDIIFQLPLLKITTQSLLNAGILAFSFVNLLLAFYIYDALTSVKVVFDLLSHGLRNIAIVFILTTKFIPKVIAIFKNTKFLYQYRSKNVTKNKMKQQLGLLEIVLNKAIARFMNVSDVLVVKGFSNKSARNKFKIGKTDYLLLVISFLITFFNIVMSVLKIGKVNFGSGNVKIMMSGNVIVGIVNSLLILMPILIGVFQYLWWKLYISKITASNMPTVKSFR